MAVKLTADSFLGIVKQSGLVPPEQLQRALEELDQQDVDRDDSQAIANALVAGKVLTRWQAEKLLQGKHKGFLLGKYRLLSLLGKGGMSSVYLAEHLLMRRRCAIKVLPANRVNDSSYLGRFHREAQAVASLDHRNIVRAYDVDQQDADGTEIHFLVMEYVQGHNLHDLVLQNGALSYDKAADVVRQAADGLAHAHHAGMVHRDIKPGNLLIDRKGVVKILDLGLARFFEEKEEFSLTVAHEEKVLGTADYLAPEQALDSHKVDARADIYSLGCTMYFLLTGHPPFTDGTLAQRLLSHQTKQPPPIHNDRPDIPPSLAALIDRMMAKDVNLRIQTAEEVSSLMAGWLSEHTGEMWKQQSPMAGETGSDVTSGIYRMPAPVAPDTDGAKSSSTALELPTSPDEVELKPLDEEQEAARQRESAGKKKKPTQAPDEESASLRPLDAADETSKPTKAPKSASDSKSGDSSAGKARPGDSDKQAAAARQKKPASDIHKADSSGSGVKRSGSGSGRQSGQKSPSSIIRPAGKPDSKTKHSRRPDSSVTRRKRAAADRVVIAKPVESDDFFGGGSAPLSPAGSGTRISSMQASSAGRGTKSRAPRKRDDSKRNIIAIVGTCAVVVAVVGYAVSNYLKRQAADDVPGVTARSRSDGAAPAPVVTQPSADLPSELRVGPQGDYPTIAAALDFARKNFRWTGEEKKLRIVVPGGQTYPEAIILDNDDYSSLLAKGIHIVSEGNAPAVLAPGGSGPVIYVNSVVGLTIEGFELKADGREIAVELTGSLRESSLRKIVITGISGVGVHCRGAGAIGSSSEDQDFFLASIEFRSAAPDAVAIQLDKQAYEPADCTITGCRFVGPMSAGVKLTSSARDIAIEHCSFYETNRGIVVTGSDRNLLDFTVSHNAFFASDIGIAFEDMPADQSLNLRIANNVFDRVGTAEAIVQKGFAPQKFSALAGENGIAHNWSNRPAPESAAPGEVDLFANKGTRGEAVQFMSTDPGDAVFLRSEADAPHKSLGPNPPK